MSHPNDSNGDALRRLEADGDDLSRPRDIDFTVIFGDVISAENFAEHFNSEEYAVKLRFAQVKADRPWDVTVIKNMIPTYEAIVAFEDELANVASALGGINDGWGCFAQLPRSLQ